MCVCVFTLTYMHTYIHTQVRARNRQFLREFQRAVQTWCTLPHTHLTVCHGMCLQEDKVMIVMELMAYGSLFDILKNSTFEMDEEMAIEILTDITKGMLCLHSSKPPMLHRCLSSGNVLLDRNLNAKLSDVGYPRLDTDQTALLQAAMRERGREEKCGAASPAAQMDDAWVLPSMVYMSPEVLKAGVHDMSDDVYAFGILCYEVVTRKDPYAGVDTPLLQALLQVSTSTIDFGSRLPLPPTTNPSLSGLCRDCMHLNGKMRPTFEEVERRMRSLCPDPGSVADRMQGMQGGSSPGGGNDEGLSSSTRLTKGLTLPVRRRARNSQNFEIFESPDGSAMLASAMAASEALLHKVFPAHVAEALKEGKKVQPEEYPCVTIFFSDIVNFTTIASSMEPALVMSMLDRLYTKFDILTERYDIFKVETIGDAYMAVVCTCTYTLYIYTH
jgi:serine/threonine protein kinase